MSINDYGDVYTLANIYNTRYASTMNPAVTPPITGSWYINVDDISAEAPNSNIAEILTQYNATNRDHDTSIFKWHNS